jgi:hypothetical protein
MPPIMNPANVVKPIFLNASEEAVMLARSDMIVFSIFAGVLSIDNNNSDCEVDYTPQSYKWFDTRNLDFKCQRDLLLDCSIVNGNLQLYCQCLNRKCNCKENCVQYEQNCSSIGSSYARNVTIFSTTFDDDYLFFAPLTALIWRSMMHYDTACIFVGEALTDLVALVVNESLAVGVAAPQL